MLRHWSSGVWTPFVRAHVRNHQCQWCCQVLAKNGGPSCASVQPPIRCLAKGERSNSNDTVRSRLVSVVCGGHGDPRYLVSWRSRESQQDIAKDLESRLGLNTLTYKANLPKRALFQQAIQSDRGRVYRNGANGDQKSRPTKLGANGPQILYSESTWDTFAVSWPQVDGKIWWKDDFNKIPSRKIHVPFETRRGTCEQKKKRRSLWRMSIVAWIHPTRSRTSLLASTQLTLTSRRKCFLVLCQAWRMRARSGGSRSMHPGLIAIQSGMAHQASGSLHWISETGLSWTICCPRWVTCRCIVHQKVGAHGDTALLFGTGKTTLSADPDRQLIGDDEHAWHTTESAIWRQDVTRSSSTSTNELNRWSQRPFRWGMFSSRTLLLFQTSPSRKLTLRISISTTIPSLRTLESAILFTRTQMFWMVRLDRIPTPLNTIVLLTDAFGVLPPISILSSKEVMYHFVSGFTSKLAGNEFGIIEPIPSFSSCFGAACRTRWTCMQNFSPRRCHSIRRVVCLSTLVGPVAQSGEGKRISIRDTRALLNAALKGVFSTDPTLSSWTILFFTWDAPRVVQVLMRLSWIPERRGGQGRLRRRRRQFARHVQEKRCGQGFCRAWHRVLHVRACGLLLLQYQATKVQIISSTGPPPVWRFFRGSFAEADTFDVQINFLASSVNLVDVRFFNPKRPKWCTSSGRVCVAWGLDMWHFCSFAVNIGHGCTKKSTPYCFGISKSIPRWPLIVLQHNSLMWRRWHHHAPTVFCGWATDLIVLSCRYHQQINHQHGTRGASRLVLRTHFACVFVHLAGVARVCQSFRLQLRVWCSVHDLFFPCHTDMHVPGAKSARPSSFFSCWRKPRGDLHAFSLRCSCCFATMSLFSSWLCAANPSASDNPRLTNAVLLANAMLWSIMHMGSWFQWMPRGLICGWLRTSLVACLNRRCSLVCIHMSLVPARVLHAHFAWRYYSSVHCRVLTSEADWFFLRRIRIERLVGYQTLFPMARSCCPLVLRLVVFLFVGESCFDVNRCFLEFVCANDASCTLCLSVASHHVTIGRLLLVGQWSTCTLQSVTKLQVRRK